MEADQPILDVSEDGIGFQNIQDSFKKSNNEKGKKKWVSIPRQSILRKGSGKLIIHENQDQLGKDRKSDNTSSSDEEGVISKFIKSASLDIPLKEYVEKVDSRGGLSTREEDHELQNILFSRSQSLDGIIKDYLDKLEHAFIRAKLRKFNSSQMNTFQPLEKVANQHLVSPTKESNFESSVSIVKETKALSESLISKEDQDMERDSFDSISATRENGEADNNTTMKLQRKG
ncbi:hypothetical protein LWI28_011196 [Acer negundo]|uniref:Uncharacterized protein n=1 Tax=Acer negundo TaxID=4023 RepID=A0AAD5ILC5_ACENE|nr:hypothetical protein LWI28_011196 [Acer negundo]KAK4841429.1 hypothetical protein QYF36_004287 [Acer negundo]